MLDSDQVTFPSFAPSLTQSPKPLRQSVHKTLNSISIHKMSINIPQNIISCQDEEQQNWEQSTQSLQIRKNQNQIVSKQQNQAKGENASRVRIFCRLRPQTKVNYNYKYDSTMIDDGQNCYSFDCIFGKFASQQFLFKKIAIRHINDFMIGKNSTIFAYGQTGSGKTHTMFGELADAVQFGIIPRTLQQIFNRNTNNDMISCSMLQIYNQKMMDLFVFPQQITRESQDLKLKQINDQIFIEGLTQIEVQSKTQILQLVKLGHKNRKVASTYNNDSSSRSHTILFVYRTYYCKGIQYKCKLCFIDLAGSEKVRKSGVKGQTLEQAKKINLSLSCLGNVVHALTTNSQHIPYRNSKLTRILKDSLSGQTNTSIITTCSTDKIDYHETISTIKFAVRAKKIKNKKKLDNVEISMEQILKKLKKQLQETKKQLDWYKMKEQIQRCNAVDIPQQDTCLMPLKTLLLNGESASSRIHRMSQNSQSRSICLSESSIIRRLH